MSAEDAELGRAVARLFLAQSSEGRDGALVDAVASGEECDAPALEGAAARRVQVTLALLEFSQRGDR